MRKPVFGGARIRKTQNACSATGARKCRGGLNVAGPLLHDMMRFNRPCVAAVTSKEWISYCPRQANLVLIAYAISEGSGEPAHPRSLARASAARSYKQ